jgi:hypothetical protein
MTRSLVVLRRLVLAVSLVGCAHLRPGKHAPPPPTFDDVLVTARALSDSGRFDDASHLLASYARRNPADPLSVESWYWQALNNLDPANSAGSIDTALVQLEEYLGAPTSLRHLDEAAALRSLARDASELGRVKTLLRQAQAEVRASDQNGDGHDDAAREIQRLRDELSAANAELERIRKRLANPRP